MKPEVAAPAALRGIQTVGGEPLSATRPALRPAGEAFRQVLERVGGGLGAAQGPVEGVRLDPRTELSPTDLLALQARVYRHGEVVDLVSRVVDRACEAVKTVVRSG